MRLDWGKICEEVSTRHFKLGFHVEMADGPYNYPYLIVHRFTTNPQTGKSAKITTCFPVPNLNSEQEALEHIYWRMSHNLQHEFAEHFWYKGKQIFFPRH